ncbi:hypothetical protein JB92DRAFT_1289753 [Gautieria morchelliformis]|nr:hypothetical protein JB92DRAFT_1289753 [Gautieria morchelliformis]
MPWDNDGDLIAGSPPAFPPLLSIDFTILAYLFPGKSFPSIAFAAMLISSRTRTFSFFGFGTFTGSASESTISTSDSSIFFLLADFTVAFLPAVFAIAPFFVVAVFSRAPFPVSAFLFLAGDGTTALSTSESPTTEPSELGGMNTLWSQSSVISMSLDSLMGLRLD